MENAVVVSWCYLASLRRSGQLKCTRDGVLDCLSKLFHKMPHTACDSVRLVTRFPPLAAHPCSSVHGVRWWDAARHLNLRPSLKIILTNSREQPHLNQDKRKWVLSQNDSSYLEYYVYCPITVLQSSSAY